MQTSLSQRDRFRLKLPYNSRKTPDTEGVIIWKWKMYLIISLLFLVTIIYFFLFSPYFKLTSIESTETLFIPNEDVTTSIQEFVDSRRYFVIPQNNYFLISKRELTTKLEDEFKLRKVTIVKEAPNGLFVYFKEQISVFVASLNDASEEIRLYDHAGESIQKLTRKDYNNQLPFVTTESYESIDENFSTIVLSSWEISNLRNSNYRIVTYIQQDNELIALTDKNFEIRFSLESDTEVQLNSLEVLQQNFLRGEPLPSEYIELRFGEKVFVK